LYEKRNVYRVELSDCSLRYRQPHNIYKNAGFCYTGDDNLMRVNLRNALHRTVVNSRRAAAFAAVTRARARTTMLIAP